MLVFSLALRVVAQPKFFSVRENNGFFHSVYEHEESTLTARVCWGTRERAMAPRGFGDSSL